MDKYNIPGDSGAPWRRKVVMRLLKEDYIDGATDYCLLVPFAEEHNLSKGQRVWLAFLYGLSYSCTTAIRVFLEFPNSSGIQPKKLRQFWREQKDTLYFNPDRKYIKYNDQLVESVKSFVQSMGAYPYRKYYGICRDSGFDGVYKFIQKNWRFFGPHGAYLFFDAVYGLLPEDYVDPEHLDWKRCGKTVGQGMAHMLYMDELAEQPPASYGPDVLEKFNKIVDKMAELSGKPKVVIESTLCAFRKFFKGTRYDGYYADRMLAECIAVQDFMPDVDLWALRRASIPKKYLGEEDGRAGIDKSRLGLWTKEGTP